jgi:predicted neutral ceramidase superfamily lipid hydrolase
MTEALEKWHDFYVLVGTAGATLVALLFVAVSLGAGFLDDKRAAATRAFYSPVVVHFTAVFFLAAIALVPAHRVVFFAALIGACAVVGFVVSLFVCVQLWRHDWTSYSQDHLAYGLLPTIAYLALTAAAAMIWKENDFALDMLAGALLLLLVVNIRNAWDLTLSMVRRHSGSN